MVPSSSDGPSSIWHAPVTPTIAVLLLSFACLIAVSVWVPVRATESFGVSYAPYDTMVHIDTSPRYVSVLEAMRRSPRGSPREGRSIWEIRWAQLAMNLGIVIACTAVLATVLSVRERRRQYESANSVG